MSNLTDIIADWQEKAKPQTVQAWSGFLGDFISNYMYNDFQMDNFPFSQEQIRAAYTDSKLLNYTGSILEATELTNVRDLFYHYFSLLISKNKMNHATLKRLHKIMTKNSMSFDQFSAGNERPGEYRNQTYFSSSDGASVPPDRIVSELDKIFDLFDNEYIDPIKISAVAHCHFEYIHPFSKSNGRIGRLMINYFLMYRGFPPIVFFAEDRDRYLNALRAYDADGKTIQPMYDYLNDSMRKTWPNTTGRKDLSSLILDI